MSIPSLKRSSGMKLRSSFLCFAFFLATDSTIICCCSFFHPYSTIVAMVHNKSVTALIFNVVQQLVTKLCKIFRNKNIRKICTFLKFSFCKCKFISFFEANKPCNLSVAHKIFDCRDYHWHEVLVFLPRR